VSSSLRTETENDPAGLLALLIRAASAWPNRPALRQLTRPSTALTFRQWLDASSELARELSRRGVKRGDHVIVVAPNRWEIPVLLFATAYCGARFTILGADVSERNFCAIAALVEPGLVILDPSRADLAPSSPGQRYWIWEPEAPIALDVFARSRENAAEAPRPVLADELAGLIFTSGSTGTPKGVCISHANVLFTTRAINERLGYRDSDCIALFLPFSFDYGLYQVFLALESGACLAVGTAASCGPRMLRVLSDSGATVFPGVPGLFAGLVKLAERRSMPLPPLRLFTNTGERLPPSTISALDAAFPSSRLFLMYGLTECKRVSILLPEERERRPDSVGRPLRGTRIYVRAPDTGSLETVGVGQLVVEGSHVTSGYFRDPEETSKSFVADPVTGARRLLTGDVCRIDDDGFLYFVERIGLQLKHRGYRLHPFEVEDVASSLPDVLRAALVKVEDRDELCLFVQLRKQAVSSADDVRARLRQRLEPYKVPDVILSVASFPTTSNGKLDRRALTTMAGDYRSAGEVCPRQELGRSD
jgi:acyl-CoA synthetase (AMP-forming)/AMP-acid ligase II